MSNDLIVQQCKRCNGDGFYYALPPRMNAFEMRIDGLAKAAVRHQCSCLGRFGHHPDPAIDFCVEVDCLEGLVRNVHCRLDGKAEVADRLFKATLFRVGGDEGAVKARKRLLELEKMLNDFQPEAA